MPSVSAMGIPWYDREDYPEIRKIMVDGNRLPDEFSEWLRRAEATERRMAAAGALVVRAMIISEQFTIWCKIRALPCQSQSRGRFAEENARDALKTSGRLKPGRR